MSIFLGILLALLVFFLVVFIHELGHFFIARKSGIKVEEFGIGIPPRIFRLFRDKKGTDWTMNLFPIGGFVRLKGEDGTLKESKAKDSLMRAKWWKQVAILLAGVSMNFLLAGVIFSILFTTGVRPMMVQIRSEDPGGLISSISRGTTLVPIFDTLDEAVQNGILKKFPGIVLSPLPGSVAEQAGIKEGDVLLGIDEVLIDQREKAKAMISSAKSPLLFHINRDNEPLTLSVNPKDGKIGAYLFPNIVKQELRYPPLLAIREGFSEVGYQIRFTLASLRAIFRTTVSPSSNDVQKQEARASIGGPVAIGKVFIGLVEHGIDWHALLLLTAMISLSLGVFNLLPFPALDGGRILFILINQGIHLINPRFKVTPRIEQMIHSVGFILLIIVSILVTWKDIFMK